MEKVNNIDSQSWIHGETTETQYVNGTKLFGGNVNILGNMQIFNVNNINVPQLESSVLTLTGNQIITGKHHFKNIIANR